MNSVIRLSGRVKAHWELLDSSKHRWFGFPTKWNHILVYLSNSPRYDLPRRTNIKDIGTRKNRIRAEAYAYLRLRGMRGIDLGARNFCTFDITHVHTAHSTKRKEGVGTVKGTTALVDLLVRRERETSTVSD